MLNCSTELIEQVRSGDKHAFKQLFDACQLPVYNYVLRLAADTHDAEDITQNVFMKVYRKISQLRDVRTFAGWLFRIARNEYINYSRSDHKKRLDSLEVEPEKIEKHMITDNTTKTLAPDQKTETRELEALLQKSLSQIPEAPKSAFVLGVLQGHSYREVAEMLNCSEANVKARVFRARTMLTKKLRPLLTN